MTGARLERHDAKSVRGFFDGVIHRIVDVDVDVAERVAELRSENRSRLRLPDAITIATAELADASVLTTDDQWPKLKLGCRVDLLKV